MSNTHDKKSGFLLGLATGVIATIVMVTIIACPKKDRSIVPAINNTMFGREISVQLTETEKNFYVDLIESSKNKIIKRRLSRHNAQAYHNNYINSVANHQNQKIDTTHSVYFQLDSLIATIMDMFSVSSRPAVVDTMGTYVYLIKYPATHKDSNQTSVAFQAAKKDLTNDEITVKSNAIFNYGQLCPPHCPTPSNDTISIRCTNHRK